MVQFVASEMENSKLVAKECRLWDQNISIGNGNDRDTDNENNGTVVTEVAVVIGTYQNIEAHDAGANVHIISKSKSGDPHTTLVRGGINAALGTIDPEDSWMMHAADTLREGEFLADYERVEVLCKSAPDAIK
jgi:aspartate oxidase